MPNQSDPVARVYAAALIELGREHGTLGTLYDELHAILRLYETETWFRQFFTSPRIDRTAKWRAIRGAFEGKVHRQVLGLLNILIAKGRESAFDNVVDQFDRFKDLAENRVHAHVVVAAPLTAEAKQSLQGRLERVSGRSVALHEKVDPAVLGGASIRIGDKVIDRTLRTRLNALRRRLESQETEMMKR